MSELADRPGEAEAPDEDAAEPSFKELLAEQLAEQLAGGKIIGGPRELIEAVLPMTLFSVVYGLHASMRTAILAAVAASVIFTVGRLIRRQSLMHAFTGLVGIVFGALLALWTGRAENFVAPSLVKNSVLAVVFAGTALTPYPVLGFFIGLLRGEGFDWPDRPDRVRVYKRANWLWAAMSVLRLSIQVPLWYLGAVTALGLANVVLGLPLFAAVMWLTWRIVSEPDTEEPDATA